MRPPVDNYILSAKEKKEADKELKKIGRRDLRKVSSIQTGELIVYKYKDPKTKLKMKKYDASPLSIVIDTWTKKGTKYMFGVNLHWLPGKSKKKIFQHILDTYFEMDNKATKNLKMVKKRFIKLLYEKIVADGELSKILTNNAFRMYIVDRMKDIRRVPIKYYKKLFGKEGQNMARQRWVHQSKNYDMGKY